ncbi:MAG: hypothetical protein CL610_09635 [Anaerolineaceae bacterium]|nr:hypothetical protein [Anaerolineaceae bacterium]
MRNSFIVSMLTVVVLLAVIQVTLAQTSITPTPAPSKTPTEDPAAEQAEATEAVSNASPITEPWTQDDLQIVTGNVQRPNGIQWFNNQLYTVCNGDSTIYEVNASTGATRTYIWGVYNAHTLHVETNESGELNLWIPDFQTNRFLRVDRSGVQQLSADLSGPWGIELYNETEFLITNLQANNVIVMTRDGQTREVVTGLRAPTGIAADDENIYVANTGSSRRGIEWISRSQIADSSTEETQPLVTGLQNTTGLDLAADGYLYFAYSLGTRGVVGRVNPDVCIENGGCTNSEIEIVVYTELAAPLAGLTISPDMRLFMHTMFSPDIYWIQLGNEQPEAETESS